MFQEYYDILQFLSKFEKKEKRKKKSTPKITLLLFKPLASQNSLPY